MVAHLIGNALGDAQAPTRGEQAFRRAHIEPYEVPGAECLRLNKVHWALNAADAVLVVHDMQNFWLRFYRDPGPLVRRVRRLHDLCAARGMPILYTAAERPRTLAERGLGLQFWGAGIGGERAAPDDVAIAAELAPRDNDYLIVKTRYSAFFGTGLHETLQKMNRRQIVLCGVFGHHGVMLTAADAYMRNYQVFLVADAVADYSREDHDTAIRYVAEVCGQLALAQTVEQALGAAQ